MGDVKDWSIQMENLLATVPEGQKQAAAAFLADYGPKFFQMAIADAVSYLRRLLAGDLDALAEMDSSLSNDEWLAKVKANTAKWENVAQYNKVRDDMKKELLLRLAPIAISLLLGLVGL